MKWAFYMCALYRRPRPGGGNELYIRAAAGVLETSSDTEDEAMGKALKFTKRFFSVDKGWSDHCCGVWPADHVVTLDGLNEAEIPR